MILNTPYYVFPKLVSEELRVYDNNQFYHHFL